MKKGTKIALWVCGGVVALLITAFMCADMIVSYIVHREVAEALKKIPDTQASVGKIYLNLISGSAVVKDISFSTHNLYFMQLGISQFWLITEPVSSNKKCY